MGLRASGSQLNSDDTPLAFMGKLLLYLQPKVMLPITADSFSRRDSVKDLGLSVPLPFPLCYWWGTMLSII